MPDNQSLQSLSEDQRFQSSNEPLGDLPRMILRHKSLVALGVVIALVVGAISYAKTTPIYQSSTNVLIVNKHAEAVAGNSMQSYFSDYMSTHKALIVSPVVVDGAIKQANLTSLKTFSGVGSQAGLTGMIIGQLSVATGSSDLGQGADNILTLSFRGTEPDECPIVVNAVLDSYKEFLAATYQDMSVDASELMTEAKDVLLKDLKQQEDAYRKFRQKSPLMTTADGNGPHPVHDRLSTIQAQQSELLLSQTKLESQLSSIESARDAGRDQEYLSMLVSNLGLGLGVLDNHEKNQTKDDDRAVSLEREKRDLSERVETMVLPLVQQEKELIEQYGPNHPLLASVRMRIKETQGYFTKLERNLHLRENDNGSGEQVDSVQLCVEYLQQELGRIATSKKLLNALYDADYELAKELTDFELTEAELQRNMARTQQLYDGIISQLQDANLVKDYGGFKADVISPAGFGYRIKPDAKSIFPMSIFLGILLGLFLAYVADVTDNTFRTPEQIKTELGLPVVGHIPQFAPVSDSLLDADIVNTSMDRSLCTYYRPMSAETEAYRGLRTGLYFSNRGRTHKVIQVTSPCPGDGKSTVVANLGVSIAQSGQRVLLIDADMRRPTQHLIFDIESESGLSTVIALDEDYKDAICETPIDNLWLMPVGPLPPDPSELLTSPRFGELLSVVREQYDYVIIDSGPLIAVSDPSVVASQVDGLLLNIQLAKTPRRQAERAREILATLNAPFWGSWSMPSADPRPARTAMGITANITKAITLHSRRSGQQQRRREICNRPLPGSKLNSGKQR